MNKLYVAIDPGFDTMKVVANGVVFDFPFNAIETDERKMNDYGIRDSFLAYKDEVGTTWRVGEYARELIFENKNTAAESIQDFYTESRFISEEFKVGLRTALALSLEKVGLSHADPCEIYLMVALPHACRSRYADTIIGSAAGKHRFSLRTGTEAEKNFSFTIEESNIFTVSQTIAAILGETSDDDGSINLEKFHLLSEGPTLVLDGGYYTFGIVPVSRGGSVDDTKTESDTHHAMKNVNLAVSKALQDKRPDIKHFVLEYMIAQNNGIVRYMEDGTAKTLDLNLLKQEKVAAVCTDFIAYLNSKYNSLLDYQYLVITGGTGACFFEQISRHYINANILPADHIILTSSELAGESHAPKYAITIGAYKGLRGKVD